MDIINSYLSEVQSTIHHLPIQNIEKVIQILHEARLNSQHVFVLGNGGSSATASHFVCDLAKSTRVPGCPDFRVIGLSDNTPIFSAYANDEGYENAFANQLSSLAEPEDVLIAFSASGNSSNVLRAIDVASRMGVRTVGFTGCNGGRMRKMLELEVNVQNDRVDQVEDVHLMLAHLISRVLTELAKPTILVTKSDLEMSDRNGIPGNIFTKRPGNSRKAKGQVGEIVDQSLQAIQQISETVVSRPDGDGYALGLVLLKMIFSFGAISGSLIVLDDTGKISDGILAYGDKAWLSNSRRMSEFLERGLASWVIKNSQGVLIPDTNTDKRWLKTQENESARSSFSVVSAPIRSDGRVLGVITLSRSNGDRFTEEDLSMLTNMLMTISESVGDEDRGFINEC